MATITSSPARPVGRARADYGLALLAWLAIGLAFAVLRLPELALRGTADTDSLMRLVEVRDYLAGAAWTDLRQPRLDPPAGVEMHWSRLVDWPISRMILIAEPWAGRAGAETLALALWPVLVLGPYLLALVALCRRLLGAEATLTALAFGIFAAPALAMMMPGNIDHHGVQLALSVALLAAASRLDRTPALGAAAGAIAAVMLAVGLETLPVVAVAGAVIALAWALEPARFAEGARGFGLAFAAGMALQRMTAAPTSAWLATDCDVASLPYVAAALIAGAGLAGLTLMAPQSRLSLRLAALGALGAVALAAVIASAPACLAGPYAEVDPRIVPIWLDLVAEARNVRQLAVEAPAELLRYFAVPLLALAVTLLAWRRAGAPDRFAWALVAAVLAVSVALSAWQVRAAIFSAAFAVPALVLLVLAARRFGEARGPALATGILIAAYLVPNQYLITLAPDVYAALRQRLAGGDMAPAPVSALANEGQRLCVDRRSFATLAGLPKGVVLAPTNLGAALLVHTNHAAVAAAYHRNAAGILDAFAALGGTLEAAKSIAARRRVDYLAACPDDDETGVILRRDPDGLLARLMRGDVPPWLEPLPGDGPLRVWRVRAERAAVPTTPPASLAELRGTQ
ncbi:hypothetical protein [Prosthecomicrobium sp. N25]|uniref:hypothetical protein n=1 Tax=Prosthecomicrobium sp. N25 TaxID=3129254 RepID=UPI003077C25A